MTLAHCKCGSTRFELYADTPLRSVSVLSATAISRLRVECPHCLSNHVFHVIPQHIPERADPERFMVALEDSPAMELDSLLQRVEKDTIIHTLKQTAGNRTDAARLMGISRSRLYRRIVFLHISVYPEQEGT